MNPVRLDAVSDPRFAYWHSATFNNDGTKVIFTDEWGGGTSARCRPTDQLNWGADAIFDIVDGKMLFRSYYKMPASMTSGELRRPQREHPPRAGPRPPEPGLVPGRPSVVDFTDSANPKEIAYFDRGPVSTTTSLVFGGFWSTYYYNGHMFATDLARGFDVFDYTPTAQLSANEIQAASEPQLDRMNAQLQGQIVWAPSFAVVRSHLDQLVRADAIGDKTLAMVNKHLDAAEAATEGKKAKGLLTAAAGQLASDDSFDALRGALLDLAGTY